MSNIIFYIIGFFIVLSGLCILYSRNAIYSLLWLINTFINVAILLIFLKSEFIAMMLILLYVGGIAVLFLFVSMMIGGNNINNVKKINISASILVILFILKIASTNILLIYKLVKKKSMLSDNNITNLTPNSITIDDIASVLYINFSLHMQIFGLILLLSIIICIYFSKLNNKINKKQTLTQQQQITRSKENSITVIY